MRRWLLAFLLVVPLFVHAQGGFGGGGFGGQGGGQGRAGGQTDVQRRPEDEEPELWTERSAIVTPGDRVEYKFELQAGETVFAAASSDAFDPGLAFEDAKGKTLAKNDDREEGDQSPFLAFRAPKAGDYTLKVLGYRSAAGGRFILKFRTFLPLDVPRGAAEIPRKPLGKDDGRTFVRLQAKKGEAIDLSAYGVRDSDGIVYPLGSTLIVGPTGVGSKDLLPIETPDGSRVFRAQTDGDYYVEFANTAETKSLRTALRIVETVMTKTTEDAAFDLAPGELKIVEFPVVPDLIVRTTMPQGRFLTRFDAPPGPSVGANEGDPGYGSTDAWTWFRLDRDSDADVVRIFHGKGTARVTFRSNSDGPQRLILRNTETLPEWTPDAALTGDPPIGGVRLFRLNVAPSELMKVAAKGERFQIRLDFFALNGGRTRTLMDRTRHVAEGDLYFSQAETNLVRLLCDGYGGAGTYTLRRDVAKPAPYALGTTGTFRFDGATFGLFSVDLEEGKAYELATEGNVNVTLLDDDGTFLSEQRLGFGGTTFHYFIPRKAGRHRIWLRSGSGDVRFSLRPFTPRGVGAP